MHEQHPAHKDAIFGKKIIRIAVIQHYTGCFQALSKKSRERERDREVGRGRDAAIIRYQLHPASTGGPGIGLGWFRLV